MKVYIGVSSHSRYKNQDKKVKRMRMKKTCEVCQNSKGKEDIVLLEDDKWIHDHCRKEYEYEKLREVR